MRYSLICCAAQRQFYDADITIFLLKFSILVENCYGSMIVSILRCNTPKINACGGASRNPMWRKRSTRCLKRFIVLLPDAFVGRDRARWSRPKVMHRAAITPGPPNRAAAADTHILNGNQTAKATVEIFKYDFFIPTPTDR
jgi:hypothetical protein